MFRAQTKLAIVRDADRSTFVASGYRSIGKYKFYLVTEVFNHIFTDFLSHFKKIHKTSHWKVILKE